MAEKKAGDNRGNKFHQKMKPYLVLQYLLRNTDENHIATGEGIADTLRADYKISAERRSIYRDIREINLAALMMEEECSLEEAQEILDADTDDEIKMVVYDKHRKGFYVRQRKFDLEDMRLLAECAYSSKFITEAQAKRMVEVVCGFVSENQAERIKHDAFLADRVKTDNKQVMYNLPVINEALSRRVNGDAHKPEKITFKYLYHDISDIKHPKERRKGGLYCVSPFRLMINDGNYYLLAVDEKHKLVPYRVDRMRDVALTGIPREDDEVFAAVDMRTYVQQFFGMHNGEPQSVTLRFIPTLLDTVIERFGTKDAIYGKMDDKHYYVTAAVKVSEPFFGWVLGFGNKMKVVGNDDAVKGFKAYLNKVRGMYE